jgi:tRNA nucleotidyltransferase (CCA-adding enzyme)
VGGLLDRLGEDDRTVLSRLRNRGEAWIVGGWVRDSISGNRTEDLDIATTLRPKEVKEIFPRSLMIGEQYGTVSVRLDESNASERIWEVTTLRREGSYGDGRRPDNVEFGDDIEADLSRRDFTINAMAIGDSGELVDPFDGLADLDSGVLRSVGDAYDRIGEDGLRIMRAFRFLDRGNGGVRDLDTSLSDAISGNLNMLENVSKERVGSELALILSGENVGEIVNLMNSHGVIGAILPGISIETGVGMTSNWRVNLALICSADEREGGELGGLLYRLLRISKDVSKTIAFLHDCGPVRLDARPSSIRRFKIALPATSQEDLLSYSTGMHRDTSEFFEALGSIGPPRAGNSPLVDGNMLSRVTGLEPSKRLGRLKGWLHRRQIEEDLISSEDVLALLDGMEWAESDPDLWPILSWP